MTSIWQKSIRRQGGCRKGSHRFEDRVKSQRKAVLALVKLGFREERGMEMTEAEAEGYLKAFEEIVDGKAKGKQETYVVRNRNKKRNIQTKRPARAGTYVHPVAERPAASRANQPTKKPIKANTTDPARKRRPTHR
jgi:hypothetical protein